MKQKIIIYLSLLLLPLYGLEAQIPSSISFQGLALDNHGKPIQSTELSVKLDFIMGSIEGDIVYTEIHSITTSNLGLYNIEIGAGFITYGHFENVQWERTNHFVRFSMAEGDSDDFRELSALEFLTMPIALAGAISETGIKGPQGLKGKVGPQGPQGRPGTIGLRGKSGQNIGGEPTQGPKGPRGPRGPRGERGMQGPKGADRGQIGEPGLPGDPGIDYGGSIPLQGPPGNEGRPGTKGEKGDQGPRGPKGATGPEGPRGPQGEGGGPQGDSGPQGPQGIVKVAAGPPGYKGTDCYDTNGNGVGDSEEDMNGDGVYDAHDCLGVQGPAGPTGATGAWGPAGYNGIEYMEMLSIPPTEKGRGFYLDDGSNRPSGLPGFRFWDDSIGTWID